MGQQQRRRRIHVPPSHQQVRLLLSSRTSQCLEPTMTASSTCHRLLTPHPLHTPLQTMPVDRRHHVNAFSSLRSPLFQPSSSGLLLGELRRNNSNPSQGLYCRNYTGHELFRRYEITRRFCYATVLIWHSFLNYYTKERLGRSVNI